MVKGEWGEEKTIVASRISGVMVEGGEVWNVSREVRHSIPWRARVWA